MTIHTLITHDGRFHADEVFAIALLSDLWPDANILRTRDDTLLAQADDNTIVVDIGGLADDTGKRCDHHQPHAPERPMGPNGERKPYSAFGLVWKHHGMAWLAQRLQDETQNVHTTLWKQMDRKLVERVDALDNGQVPPHDDGLAHPLSVLKQIDLFSPDFDDNTDESQNQGFHEAVGFAKGILHRMLRKVNAERRASEVVSKAIKTRQEPHWFELPAGMPYLNELKRLRANTVLFVVMPTGNGQWNVSCVRDQAQTLGVKHPFPESWAGLRNADLEEASGIPGAVFCHNGRFLFVCSHHEGAMMAIEKAMATPAAS